MPGRVHAWAPIEVSEIVFRMPAVWAPLQKSADDRMPAVGSTRDAYSLGSLYTRQLGCLWAPLRMPWAPLCQQIYTRLPAVGPYS